jgi:hypothetical protein
LSGHDPWNLNRADNVEETAWWNNESCSDPTAALSVLNITRPRSAADGKIDDSPCAMYGLGLANHHLEYPQGDPFAFSFMRLAFALV